MKYLISPDNKLCLFWRPKCGCSTAVEIFFKYIGYDYSKYGWIHKARAAYQKTQPKEIPPDSIKLQIVRNPYDRAISGFFHWVMDPNGWWKNKNPKEILLKWSKTPLGSFNGQEITELMARFYQIFSNKGQPKTVEQEFKNSFLQYHLYDDQYMTDNLDYVIKLENLNSDLKTFNQKFNFSLENSRYSPHSMKKLVGEDFHTTATSQIYSLKKNKKIIQEAYKKDFEYFNYPL
jgi:hypothetical protein